MIFFLASFLAFYIWRSISGILYYIWHSIWHSIPAFYLAFYSAILSDIFSDIGSGPAVSGSAHYSSLESAVGTRRIWKSCGVSPWDSIYKSRVNCPTHFSGSSFLMGFFQDEYIGRDKLQMRLVSLVPIRLWKLICMVPLRDQDDQVRSNMVILCYRFKARICDVLRCLTVYINGLFVDPGTYSISCSFQMNETCENCETYSLGHLVATTIPQRFRSYCTPLPYVCDSLAQSVEIRMFGARVPTHKFENWGCIKPYSTIFWGMNIGWTSI